MSFSDPWADSIDIIALQPVEKWIGIIPMILSAPRDNSLVNILLQIVKKVAKGLALQIYWSQ